jgi:hypothetical protein
MKGQPGTLLAFLLLLGLPALASAGGDTAPGPVVELFEDDTPLVRQLTVSDRGSEARRQAGDVYSGVYCIRVTPLQRYHPVIPGWNYPIVEKPGKGQYRYLRFAWKTLGGRGIMLQLSERGNWERRRYVAGLNSVGWAATQVAPQPPTEWTVVTRDLFADFGPLVITGIALTPMDGTAGLYDHIYLARTLEDLDRLDAANLGKKSLKGELPADRLKALWGALASRDAATAYPALWTLAAAGKQAVPLFREHIRPEALAAQQRQLAPLLRDLDDNRFAVREAASAKLQEAGTAAAGALRKALEHPASNEVRRRVTVLLERIDRGEAVPSAEDLRLLRAVRALELIGTAEASEVLTTLAVGAPDADLAQEARQAVERLRKRPPAP